MTTDNQILECDFGFKCPKNWDDLTPSDKHDVKHCNVCEKDVFFISTREELQISKLLGRCIAAKVGNPEIPRGITIGGARPLGATDVAILGPTEEANETLAALLHMQNKDRKLKTEK